MATSKIVLETRWNLRDKHLSSLRNQLNYLTGNINQLQSQKEYLEREIAEVEASINTARDEYFDFMERQAQGQGLPTVLMVKAGHWRIDRCDGEIIVDEVTTFDEALNIAKHDGHKQIVYGYQVLALTEEGEWRVSEAI